VLFIHFLAAVWFWARKRRGLEGAARTTADLQLISFVFFYLAASVSCAILGNPFSGLFFPEKVLELNSLPWHYAQGTKLVIYFALGWLFTFLSQLESYRASTTPARP